LFFVELIIEIDSRSSEISLKKLERSVNESLYSFCKRCIKSTFYCFNN